MGSKQAGYFLVNPRGRITRDLPVTPADTVTNYLQEAFAKVPPMVCRLCDLDHWLRNPIKDDFVVSAV